MDEHVLFNNADAFAPLSGKVMMQQLLRLPRLQRLAFEMLQAAYAVSACNCMQNHNRDQRSTLAIYHGQRAMLPGLGAHDIIGDFAVSNSAPAASGTWYSC